MSGSGAASLSNGLISGFYPVRPFRPPRKELAQAEPFAVALGKTVTHFYREGYGFHLDLDSVVLIWFGRFSIRFGSDSIRRRFHLFWAGIRFAFGWDCLDAIRSGFGFRFIWHRLHLIRLDLNLLLETSYSIRWRFDSVRDSIQLGFDSIWTWLMPSFLNLVWDLVSMFSDSV